MNAKISARILEQILHSHAQWLNGIDGGRCADLNNALLHGVNLRGANLRNANLHGVDLSDANLQGADLSGTDLSGANLRAANLRGTDLRGTYLRAAYLRWSDLDGALFDDVYTDIPVTLSEVRDLILSHVDRLNMNTWHSDNHWRDKPVDECGTSHCVAGWTHHLASLKRPKLLASKINTWLVGRMALGEEAASHFYDSDEEALNWLKRVRVHYGE